MFSKLIETVHYIFTMMFLCGILCCVFCNTSFAAKHKFPIQDLVSGYYYIDKIDVSVDRDVNGNKKDKIRAYKELAKEFYFYYDASNASLTVYSVQNIGVCGKLLYSEKDNAYVTEIVRTTGLLRIPENEKEQFIPNDATHFTFTLFESAAWSATTAVFHCTKVAKNDPRLIAVQKEIESIGAQITKNFAPTQKKLAAKDFSTNQGLLRTYPFGSVILPVSMDFVPVTPDDEYYIFNEIWCSAIFNKEQKFDALYKIKNKELIIAAFSGSESQYDWDIVIKEEISRPEYLLYREPNGIIYYDAARGQVLAQYHYYNAKKNMHIVARVLPLLNVEFDRTVHLYKFMRTINPEVKKKQSSGINFAKLTNKSVSFIENNFMHTYSCEAFISQEAINHMTKHGTRFENLISKCNATGSLVYDSDISKEKNPNTVDVHFSVVADPVEDVLTKLENDGSKVVYREGPYVITAKQEGKMRLHAHFIQNKNGLTLHAKYTASSRSPLAAVNFFQQLKKMTFPDVYIASETNLKGLIGKFIDVRKVDGRSNAFEVSLGDKKDGVITTDGKIIIPLEYDFIWSTSSGYEAWDPKNNNAKVYFDINGNIKKK